MPQERHIAMQLRRAVPSLSALATFEAAARLESFTLTAAELGVTQAAVSRQVKALEGELNTLLFRRGHRRVTLTAAGAALASTLGTSFARIAEMIETIRQPVVPDTVTVGATLAFSHFWLVPRLAEFRSLHPEVKLRLVADDGANDVRRDRLDVAVRYGRPPFDDAEVLASLPDSAFPVCSPRLLERMGMTADGADLARLPLIASDLVNPTWLTWRGWAKAMGLGPALGRAADLSRLRFNHYTDTVQAALNGEGVALGWARLLADHLREGRLVRIGAGEVSPPEWHHLIVPLGRGAAPATQAFLDWISGRFVPEG